MTRPPDRLVRLQSTGSARRSLGLRPYSLGMPVHRKSSTADLRRLVRRTRQQADSSGTITLPASGLRMPGDFRSGVTMARLSIDEIYAAARAAGFSPQQASTWTAIAMAESGGSPGALNNKGEHSMGLWQINVAAGGAQQPLGGPQRPNGQRALRSRSPDTGGTCDRGRRPMTRTSQERTTTAPTWPRSSRSRGSRATLVGCMVTAPPCLRRLPRCPRPAATGGRQPSPAMTRSARTYTRPLVATSPNLLGGAG